MNGTEVRVSSCGREGVREALSSLQYRRLFELIVSTRHNVWHVVVVSTGHGCACRYGECLWREAEVFDDNLSRALFDGN